jgi:hypothetical protein
MLIWNLNCYPLLKGHILDLWTKACMFQGMGVFFFSNTIFLFQFKMTFFNWSLMFLHLLNEKNFFFLSNCQIWFEAPSNQIHSHCRLDFDHRSNSRYFFHLFFSCNAQCKFKSLMCHNWIAIDKMLKDTSQIEYLILKTIFSFTYQIRF